MSANSKFMYQPLFKDEYCEIVMIESIPCLCHRYFHSPKDCGYLRNNLQFVLELAKKELSQGKYTPYLIEVYEGKLLPSDDVTWIQKDFITQLWESGIRYVAYVSKNNVFSQFVMETLLEGKSPEKVTIRIFQDIEDAFQWLACISIFKPA